MRYRIKPNLIQSLLFLFVWLIVNYSSGISLTAKITDPIYFANNIMNETVGFNGLTSMIGFVFTFVYIFSFKERFKITQSFVIAKYGRENYVSKCNAQAAAHAVVFAFELWAVNTVCILIFCSFDMLVSLNFFLMDLFYLIALCVYFLLYASVCSFFRFTMRFSKLYIIPPLIIMGIFRILAYFLIFVGPVNIFEFIDDWQEQGTFDAVVYVRNLAVCIIVSLIINVVSKLIFVKKDILIDEKEN